MRLQRRVPVQSVLEFIDQHELGGGPTSAPDFGDDNGPVEQGLHRRRTTLDLFGGGKAPPPTAERELGPCASSTPSGSSNNAFKNQREEVLHLLHDGDRSRRHGCNRAFPLDRLVEPGAEKQDSARNLGGPRCNRRPSCPSPRKIKRRGLASGPKRDCERQHKLSGSGKIGSTSRWPGERSREFSGGRRREPHANSTRSRRAQRSAPMDTSGRLDRRPSRPTWPRHGNRSNRSTPAAAMRSGHREEQARRRSMSVEEAIASLSNSATWSRS